MPPIVSETPMAIGVVTDLGTIESMVVCESPSTCPMPITERMATTQRRGAAGKRQPEFREFRTLLVKRHRKRDRGGTEQKVNEARAREVRVVGNARRFKQGDQTGHGDDDGGEERVEARQREDALADHVKDERDGEPERGIRAEFPERVVERLKHGSVLVGEVHALLNPEDGPGGGEHGENR